MGPMWLCKGPTMSVLYLQGFAMSLRAVHSTFPQSDPAQECQDPGALSGGGGVGRIQGIISLLHFPMAVPHGSSHVS